MYELVSLSDVQVALGLFAEALVGAPVPFEVVDDRSCWPWRVGNPHAASVTLPNEATRQQFRSMVLHQLLTLPTAERRDPPADVSAEFFATAYALVEDIRADACTQRFFPGARGELDRLLQEVEDVEGSQHAILEALRRLSLGHPESEMADVLHPHLRAVLTGTATCHDSYDAAIAITRAAHAGGRALIELVGEGEAADDDIGLSSEGTSGVALDTAGAPSQVVENQALTGGHASSDALDGAEFLPADQDQDEVSLGLVLPFAERTALSAELVRTFRYDEWDYRVQKHRRSWCRVVEEVLHGDDVSFIADVRQRHQGLRSRIRNSFARLRPAQLVRVHRSNDGDDIDLDAVIEAIADRRSGAAADERLHVRRDRAARDVATAFLVDLSASTSAPAVPPEPEPPAPESDPFDDPLSYGPLWERPRDVEPTRRVIDVAKDAVALMCDALNDLGDQHAVYGFSGTGRNNVDFKIAKDFGDRVSSSTWASIAEMKPLRYTRMGPAIRHGAAKLAKQQVRTRLLIIVSDGYPQDVDYGDDRADREYGVQDTAHAISEANMQGIHTFCVTIDPAGHDYLRVMFPDRHYLIVDEVEALPEELAKLYVGLSS